MPSHVIQKVRERIDIASRKQPGLGRRPSQDLTTQLQYFDLRELQDTIMAKALWPRFAELFMTKEALSMRFAQLAELRNAIRHSRDVTAIMRNDGEAATRWFREALEAAQFTAATDSATAEAMIRPYPVAPSCYRLSLAETASRWSGAMLARKATARSEPAHRGSRSFGEAGAWTDAAVAPGSGDSRSATRIDGAPMRCIGTRLRDVTSRQD